MFYWSSVRAPRLSHLHSRSLHRIATPPGYSAYYCTATGATHTGVLLRGEQITHCDIVCLSIKFLHNTHLSIPHSTGSSSDPSGQSWFELHRKCELVQFPSLHWNWPRLQWRRGHVDGSSEPSLQSLCPSHFHQIGMQLHRESKDSKITDE